MRGEHECLVIRAPIATLFAEPRVASAPISQLLAGRVVEIFEERDDWYRVRGPDDYEGWIHRGYVARVSGDGAEPAQQHDRISLGCVTRTPNGRKRSMPLGAFLCADERLQSGEAIAARERSERFPTDTTAITRSAQLFYEGTSYIWGGVTPWGCDCSGLVQTVYWLHGVQLNRDAWQQSLQGTPGEAALLDARVGDLLFFSDRVDQHITHVAISLGDCSLVHLALGRGGYAVEQLRDTRDGYVQKLHERFVKARRIIT
jgi:hypothetical protein